MDLIHSYISDFKGGKNASVCTIINILVILVTAKFSAVDKNIPPNASK
jgi:hypothetical protein